MATHIGQRFDEHPVEDRPDFAVHLGGDVDRKMCGLTESRDPVVQRLGTGGDRGTGGRLGSGDRSGSCGAACRSRRGGSLRLGEVIPIPGGRDESADLLERAGAGLLDLRQRGRTQVVVVAASGGLGEDDDAGHLVCDEVVEFGGDATSLRLGGGGLFLDQRTIIRSQHESDRDRGDDQPRHHEGKGQTVGHEPGDDDVRHSQHDDGDAARLGRGGAGEHRQRHQAQPQTRQTQGCTGGGQDEGGEETEDCPQEAESSVRMAVGADEGGQCDCGGEDVSEDEKPAAADEQFQGEGKRHRQQPQPGEESSHWLTV